MTGSSDVLLDVQLSAFRWADNTRDPRWRHAKLLGQIKRMFRWISDKRCGSVERMQDRAANEPSRSFHDTFNICLVSI